MNWAPPAPESGGGGRGGRGVVLGHRVPPRGSGSPGLTKGPRQEGGRAFTLEESSEGSFQAGITVERIHSLELGPYAGQIKEGLVASRGATWGPEDGKWGGGRWHSWPFSTQGANHKQGNSLTDSIKMLCQSSGVTASPQLCTPPHLAPPI